MKRILKMGLQGGNGGGGGMTVVGGGGGGGTEAFFLDEFVNGDGVNQNLK